MEENENQNVENHVDVERIETVESNDPINESTKNVKNKKNLFIIIAVVVIAILIIFCAIFNNTKSKAKRAVKDYIKAMGKADVKKIMKLTDPYASYVFDSLDEDEYDDFWEEYKDFVKEKDDEYEDVKDEWEDSQDDIEDAKDSLEELLEDRTIKVKKIVSVRKEGKNLYKVKAKIETKEKGEKKETDNQVFYVMKKGMKCYIVGYDFYNY